MPNQTVDDITDHEQADRTEAQAIKARIDREAVSGVHLPGIVALA